MVTVHLADCRSLAGRFAELLPLLDGARREKAESRGDTRAGRQCLAAGLLLCRAFGQDQCESIRFGPQGKPCIPGARPFSLSHAGDYAVLAMGDGAVGVDIERRSGRNTAAIAKRFFHPAELAFVEGAPDPAEAFLTIWTLKESYLKAEGCGFHQPPSSFCVLPKGTDAACMAGESGYFFRRYPAPAGYALAVCAREKDFSPRVERIDLAPAQNGPG